MRAGNRSMRIQVGNNAVLFAVVALEMAFSADSLPAVSHRRRVLRPLSIRTNLLLLGVRQALQRQ